MRGHLSRGAGCLGASQQAGWRCGFSLSRLGSTHMRLLWRMTVPAWPALWRSPEVAQSWPGSPGGCHGNREPRTRGQPYALGPTCSGPLPWSTPSQISATPLRSRILTSARVPPSEITASDCTAARKGPPKESWGALHAHR